MCRKSTHHIYPAATVLLLLLPWLLLLLLRLLQMGCGDNLPAEVTEEMLQDDGFLQTFHHALLEVSAAAAQTYDMTRATARATASFKRVW